MDMKITKDGFIWKIVTKEAKKLFLTGLFSLYVLHEDDSESLIENLTDLDEALLQGLQIGIEVGFFENN